MSYLFLNFIYLNAQVQGIPFITSPFLYFLVSFNAYLVALPLAPGLSVLDFFEETSSDSNFLFNATIEHFI